LDVFLFVVSLLVYACMAIYSLLFPMPSDEPRPDDLGHFMVPIYTEYSARDATSEKREP
jgi:hypothetical protein